MTTPLREARTPATHPDAFDAPADVEVRSVSSTGAEKGTKLARFDLVPVGPLTELAKHYGRGSAKYADRNWEAGYEWSKSYAALMRHLTAFWGGEDIDEETGTPHIIAVAWHAFALAEYMKTHPEFDDRPTSVAVKNILAANPGMEEAILAFQSRPDDVTEVEVDDMPKPVTAIAQLKYQALTTPLTLLPHDAQQRISAAIKAEDEKAAATQSEFESVQLFGGVVPNLEAHVQQRMSTSYAR